MVSVVVLSVLGLSLASAIGSLPFFFVHKLSERRLALAAALCAGLTLSAAFGILHSALEDRAPSMAFLLISSPGDRISSESSSYLHVFDVVIGVGLGVCLLSSVDLLLRGIGLISSDRDAPLTDTPNQVVKNGKRTRGRSRSRNIARIETEAPPVSIGRRASTFLASVTMHAIAEGVGAGIAFASGTDSGFTYVTAMCLHNIPEGIAVSAVLIGCGLSPTQTLFANVLHTLPQVLVALPAFWLVEWARHMQALAAGIAAGTLLFTSLADLLPDAFQYALSHPHELSSSRVACFVIAAAVVMLCFEVFLEI